ncbi:MAG TPA: nitroreductase family protein [Victivallales bacterium]|nr:nitroreductase family protein [Victivallales bacterium]
MLRDLIKTCRSYRRFSQEKRIDEHTMIGLVDLARLTASGQNKQPLKFIIIKKNNENNQVFSCLKWAGALKDWEGPAVNERPTGYIIIVGDKTIKQSFGIDHGIAAQSIMLGAAEAGFGGCMIGSILKTELNNILKLNKNYEILLVLALGSPAETVVIEEIKDNNTDYWRDEKSIHHVPKRSLEEIIIK